MLKEKIKVLKVAIVLLFAISIISPSYAQEDEFFDEENSEVNAETEIDTAEFAEFLAAYTRIDSIYKTLVFDTVGSIPLINGVVNMEIPEGYKFLSKDQSYKVYVEVWNNPPGVVTEGFLMPINSTLFDDSLKIIDFTYSDDGHVKDDDAEDLDYSELLSSMQEEHRQNNISREQQGYEPYYLDDWAKEPFYDAENKKLHWAKKVRMGDDGEQRLEYEVRVLGREGTLSMRFLGELYQLDEIEEEIPTMMDRVNFTEGNTYADYDESTDRTAEYGIGGLIAGGLILKGLAKVGFLAKFWKFIVLGIAGLGALVRKMFKGKKDGENPTNQNGGEPKGKIES